MSRKRVVVCGATGSQGGAVVDSLLGAGEWEVVGLSRDPESAAARKLAQRGVEVVAADLQDRPSLERAFSRADAVFGVTQPWSPDYKKCDKGAEIEQGGHIVAACKANDVPHLVFTSVFLVGSGKSGVDHVDSKVVVETEIKASGLPYTILRPVAFMDMLGSEIFPIKERSCTGLTGRAVKMPWICCADIGHVARIAISDPEKYRGEEIGLIGDFLSGDELAQVVAKLKGVPAVSYRSPPGFLVWLLGRLGVMAFEFYQMRVVYTKWGTPPFPPEIELAVAELKKIHPGVMTVERHLATRENLRLLAK